MNTGVGRRSSSSMASAKRALTLWYASQSKRGNWALRLRDGRAARDLRSRSRRRRPRTPGPPATASQRVGRASGGTELCPRHRRQAVGRSRAVRNPDPTAVAHQGVKSDRDAARSCRGHMRLPRVRLCTYGSRFETTMSGRAALASSSPARDKPLRNSTGRPARGWQ